ncbi:hypothetical protein MPSEU_000241100 [Mayamaea pseudoterrestris]|nr:hypothetical protein MPSEU_000241100 [Mayamaea pseudoterrestris]
MSSNAPQSSTASSAPLTDDQPVYKFLVLDSGPIIKLTSISTLWKRAQEFYTVPAVLDEIRDAKARQHLNQLPMPLQTRIPSNHSMQVVSDFSKQTGDYQSLSTTDLQVMALVYELEREACGGNVDHVRRKPKRIVGLGPMQILGSSRKQTVSVNAENGETKMEESKVEGNDEEVHEDVDDADSDSDSSDDDDDDDNDDNGASDNDETSGINSTNESAPVNSWAKIVNPRAASTLATVEAPQTESLHVPFGKLVLGTNEENQFSDADDDPAASDDSSDHLGLDVTIEQELEQGFPSLAAAATVPMEDECEETDVHDDALLLEQQLKLEEERKKEALKPVSKSGKMYNSFTKYSDLFKPKPKPVKADVDSSSKHQTEQSNVLAGGAPLPDDHDAYEQSRIVGGLAFSGQDDDVEDDGEGWITNSAEISTMKASGALDPMRSTNTKDNATAKQMSGPLPSERAACATTDFAMQNVLLQMNLELLSVDGMKVRKLKSWVTRCGSCYKIFTSTDNLGPLKCKRLFCSHCGSDFLQRISCSVDGKTGRLKLHFSKRYKNNLRGTKFSLPKPSSGNRFQGDLLLREDQLLVGAWNQKVKMMSGGKSRDAAQSIFGKDIASNVGCKASTTTTGDDIRVGFGRRNPNSAKGRERRGKRKKTADKACGLRR